MRFGEGVVINGQGWWGGKGRQSEVGVVVKGGGVW